MARVALVTGGTRGIGAAISRALKDAGYKVAANYGGNRARADAFSRDTGIPSYQWDVGDFKATATGIASVTDDLGAIDVLVNNAGITRDAPLHRMTEEQWDEVIRVDLSSCYNTCRAVVDGMRERGFGRIVNISSINGQAGQFGQANYSAAKAGIIGFTKALALEGARRGITVNAICPGYIDTEMVQAVPDNVLQTIIARIPVGRLGSAEEIARAVLFLVADEAGFVTGATLTINGGQYLT
jgi:acetoacetyl-CoA reductase